MMVNFHWNFFIRIWGFLLKKVNLKELSFSKKMKLFTGIILKDMIINNLK